MDINYTSTGVMKIQHLNAGSGKRQNFKPLANLQKYTLFVIDNQHQNENKGIIKENGISSKSNSNKIIKLKRRED